MERFPPQSTPAPLYVRALELDLVPRRIPDLAPYALPAFYYEDRPTLYVHRTALLAAADLTPVQREQIERGALAYARWVTSNPEQGVNAFSDLVPVLSPEHQAAARAEAQPVLIAFARLVHGRDWEAPWGTLLRYRDRWRVLSPDTYGDWLQEQCAALLRFRAWNSTPGPYREHLAHLHLLTGEDYERAITMALESIRAVDDPEVNENTEWGFAGGRIYNDDDVDAATRAAQIAVLTAIAPLLPPSLHARARELAEERGHDLGDLPGSALGDVPRMRGTLWYHAQPDIPVPWLTPHERRPAFHALDPTDRATMIAQFADDYVHLIEEYLSNRARRAVANDPVAAHYRRLVADDLPVAARFLDAEQVRRLLAYYAAP